MTLTTDERALLAAVIAEPESDAARLVFADAIEERGEEAYAEFIRVQVELAATAECPAWCDPKDETCERRILQRREVELWTTVVRPIFEVNGFQAVIENGMMRDQLRERRVIVRRGFVAEVRGPLELLRGTRCDNCAGRGFARRPSGTGDSDCPNCDSVGRVGGVLMALAGSQPVERVEVTDMTIFESGGNRIFYVGNLGIFAPKYWGEIQWTRKSALDALSRATLAEARDDAAKLASVLT